MDIHAPPAAECLWEPGGTSGVSALVSREWKCYVIPTDLKLGVS